VKVIRWWEEDKWGKHLLWVWQEAPLGDSHRWVCAWVEQLPEGWRCYARADFHSDSPHQSFVVKGSFEHAKRKAAAQAKVLQAAFRLGAHV